MSKNSSWLPNVKSPIPNVHPSAPDESQKSSFSSLQLCNMTSKSHVIAIPVKDADGYEHQVLREVHPYPRACLQTSSDKVSYIQSSKNGDPRHRRTKKKSHRKSSTASTSSQITNVSSDISSDVSNVSDLSGYEDEYSAIRKVVKQGATAGSYKDLVAIHSSRSPKEPSFYEAQCQEQEIQLRLLTSQKEELEIQLHRVSIQLENSLREKELSQQQVDLLNTKATEVTQKEHFEILKQNASLQGQHDMLKLQLEKVLTEKLQTEAKLDSIANDFQTFKQKYDSLKSKNLILEESLSEKNGIEKNLRFQLEDYRGQVEFHRKEALMKDKENAEMKSSLVNLQGSLDANIIENKRYMKQNEELISSLDSVNEKLLLAEGSIVEKDTDISKLTVEKSSLENTNKWYKEQLSHNQTSKSKVLDELTESKGVISSLTSEKKSFEQEISKLKRNLEDLQCQMVRDKASFVSHLEEVEANMKEREAALKVPDPTSKNATNQRLKELEQSQQQLRKQTLEVQQLNNMNKSLKEELQFKKNTLDKHEIELTSLRKTNTVLEEKLKQKDVQLKSIESKLEHMTIKCSDTNETLTMKELEIAKQNTKINELKADLSIANQTIVNVDEATTNLKENMSKLTSNFSKLKHDLASKDKDLEKSRSENSILLEQNKKSQSDAEVSKEKHSKELEHFRKSIQEKEEIIAKLEKSVQDKSTEITQLNQHSKEISIELTTHKNSESILQKEKDNLVSNCSLYKSNLVENEKKIDSMRNIISQNEKELEDRTKEISSFSKRNLKLQEEVDELAAIKSLDSRKISDLEESIVRERRQKQSLERFVKEQKDSWTSIEKDLRNQLEQKIQENKELEALVANSTDTIRLRDIQIDSLKHTLENIESNSTNSKMQELNGTNSRYKMQTKLVKRKHRKLLSEMARKNRILGLTRRRLAEKCSELSSIDAKESPYPIGSYDKEGLENGKTQLNGDNDHINGFTEEMKLPERLVYQTNEKLLSRKLKEHMRGRLKAEKEVEALVKESKRSMEESSKKYNDLMNRFLSLDEEHQTKLGTIRNLQNETEKLEASLQSSMKEKEFLEENILILKRENSRMEEIEKMCQRKQTMLSSLEDKIKHMKNQFEETKKELESMMDLQENWKTEEKTLKQNIGELEDTKIQLEKKLSAQTISLDKYVFENNELECRITELTEDLESKVSEMTNTKEMVTCKEKMLKDLRIHLDEMRSKAEKMGVKCAELQKQMQQKGLEKENTEKLLKDSEERAASSIKEVETLHLEIKSLKSSYECSLKEFEERLSIAKSVESSLNTKLEEVLQQKLFYQSHTTDLKSALNTALAQLKKLKRNSSASPLKPPPPLPIDKETLDSLLNQRNSMDSPSTPLDSISERLSLLRSEISSLQKHVTSRNPDASFQDLPSE